ncbi:D-alanyl-D-alanine carboxypeptidase/D-alanyl-D-alanine endopeptidase [Microbacterium sediminicola]
MRIPTRSDVTTRHLLIRPISALALLAAGALALAGCASGAGQDAVAVAVDEAIADSGLDGGGWGVLAVDRETGEIVYELNSTIPFVPGSVQKSFTTSAALEILGAESTITTPVYGTGVISADGVLEGDLVLAGRGDFSFGLRDQPDGTLEITSFDHNEANSGLVAVGLNTGDPLAALRGLAEQLVAAGVTSVAGQVLVDDTYFDPQMDWPDGRIDAIWVNENLVDLVITPGELGAAPEVRMIPGLDGLALVNEVETIEGDVVDVDVEMSGSTVTATGTIGIDAGEVVRNTEVDDPAAFARMAFAQVLTAAGITIDGGGTGMLPSAYDEPIAQWESAPIWQLARVVQKMSYNRGADLLACLIAVEGGSTSCVDGVAAVADYTASVGVPTEGLRLYDPAGSNDYNRTSAVLQVALMRQAAAAQYGELFVDIQPVAGIDGSLSGTGAGTSAEGMIQAKTGSRVVWYPTTGQFFELAQAYSGYMTTDSGRDLVFAILFNSTLVDDVPGVLDVSAKVAEVMFALQREG